MLPSRIWWGVFELDAEHIHVAPCWSDGELLAGHVLDELCYCHPRVDEWDERLIVHNMPGRRLH